MKGIATRHRSPSVQGKRLVVCARLGRGLSRLRTPVKGDIGTPLGTSKAGGFGQDIRIGEKDEDAASRNHVESVPCVEEIDIQTEEIEEHQLQTDEFELRIPSFCESDVEHLSFRELCRSDAVYNVEMSWLAFNWRVLAMACKERVPLLERLFYLGISASNLDEFFAKRVGGLKRQVEASKEDLLKDQEDLRWTPMYQLQLISQNTKKMVAEQTKILYNHLEPQLLAANIRILKAFHELPREEQERLHAYFIEELELLLTPIKLDSGHPFPFLPSLGLGIAVRLQDTLDSARTESYAVVNVPSNVERWIKIDMKGDIGSRDGGVAYLPIEQLIISHLDELFGGWRILDAWPYRVTRNAELERHEDDAEDLLEMIAEEVRERMFAPFVRLEVQAETPDPLVQLLTKELELDAEQDVYYIESLLDLSDLKGLKIDAPNLPLSDLKFKKFSPVPFKVSTENISEDQTDSIFDTIATKDVLIHNPFESFESSTLRFLNEAAADPKVLAIKATVYRTSSDSPVIRALLRAAECGKHVAVLMELKARFDEARNVVYAQELESAGCSVAYGLVGFKTHCKIILVVRKEPKAPSGLRTYVHVGTGNYNPVTAGLYTDFSLFSCDAELGRDVMDVFKHLTGLHRQRAVGGYRKLLVAHVYMRDKFIAKIDREIRNAKAGKHAAILVKVNGLDDRKLVAKLYEASQANVRVDCIVRGMCRIRPGVRGFSDNVRVVSVIGRFLEHHRVCVFHNDGDPEYYIGSADWMSRNLDRRVEVATPILDTVLQSELCDILACFLNDQKDAWEMLSDGTYQKNTKEYPDLLQAACFPQNQQIRPLTKWCIKRSAEIGAQCTLMEYHKNNYNRFTPMLP